jgi:hypothetical protein
MQKELVFCDIVISRDDDVPSKNMTYQMLYTKYLKEYNKLEYTLYTQYVSVEHNSQIDKIDELYNNFLKNGELLSNILIHSYIQIHIFLIIIG